ncbi:2-aminoethylphosphonate--pyruvate transaminase [Rubrivivax gelatinosus]|uniref:2-aminoethylphosphonate--pyruvate transaminase n=1 Tax=Rubrivivax gelatinosus TaxID=28068 RepID=UPI0003106435|nr:2-aminoethylphosphonate--pyruvate transaminase [Rubrivivax gelatinosus]MBG6078387.1 2-aminoethylphosphonate-pyruvate transaminase [Rubrivivax gelatinosus]
MPLIDRDPLLLTPGPLSTSLRTKQAMLHDRGSWDEAFNRITAEVCRRLVDIVHAGETHVAVPMQGSGTFAVEAALGTLVPRDGRVLVPNHGAYCARILRILATIGRAAVELTVPEDQPMSPAAIAAALDADPGLSHVAVVHCETGTGILNPLEDIARAVAERGRALIVDAMSSYAAVAIDARTTPFDALVAASGKGLEGVPGMGFVIARRTALEASAGRCHSLALDLHDQWRYLQRTTQWRFTPPTHVVAALAEALRQFDEEGGVAARGARYAANGRRLVDGLGALGLQPFLRPEVQSPVIVTFHAPRHPAWDFDTFYHGVRERGYILYPGKLTRVETFRVGCIGALAPADVDGVVDAVARTLRTMGIPTPR